MSRIIAIGGGDIRKETTLKIDEEIIRISDKSNPKLLFIPTASNDSLSYSECVKDYFGGKFNCQIDILNLINCELTKKQIEEKIFNSNIIYVGGGDTYMMMKLWRKMKVDEMLLAALKNNIVLSGISAGSVCWFNFCHSDSIANNELKYNKIKGLGFINAINCPHFNTEIQRQESLKNMIKKNSLIAIALDDCCAIEIIDNKYRILKDKQEANAYKLYWKKGIYYKEVINYTPEFNLLSDLLIK